MELTSKQQQGLDIAIQRYKNKERYTVISGYAGTGKSTLVRFIISALGQLGVDPEQDVCFSAFTGKAVQVLAKKGNKNTYTLHKLLYDSFPRPDGTFFRKPKVDLDYHIVVVDEVSMAPKTLMDLLFSYGCYVICLGDPYQLPPINPNEDNHLLDHPHIFLDEIMRQAAESEIIQLTMKIRSQKPIDNFIGKEVQVLDSDELNTGMLQWADQILCATNKTRLNLNQQVRNLNGIDNNDLPQDGEKLICLRNYWGLLSEDGNDLINGTIGYLKNPFQTNFFLPRWISGQILDVTQADFESDTGDLYMSLDMDTHMIMTGDKCLDNRLAYRLSKNPKTQHLVPLEFVFGYAITCHKSQGSEWDKVLVIEEGFPFDKEEHSRWLYTACTRAAEKLVLVR
jgi:exodeoxyribonuclease-5